MIRQRRASERGHADHGWLDSYHSFSFANYYDPEQLGFRALRVINEDWIAPGAGFPKHPHRNMEILTYVVSGALRHQDSMGNGSVIHAGSVQRMSAGRGVRHSEYNDSESEKLHLLQIWIEPAEQELDPSYEERTLKPLRDQLKLLASPSGRESSMLLHQDAEIYAALLGPGVDRSLVLEPGRHAWIQLIRGSMTVNEVTLGPGDALGLSCEESVRLVAGEDEAEAEALVFDLA